MLEKAKDDGWGVGGGGERGGKDSEGEEKEKREGTVRGMNGDVFL